MTRDEKVIEYAKSLLLKTMEEISEDHYCAGWMSGIEFDLWHIVQGADRGYGMSEISPETVEKVRMLAADAGGWFVWDKGPAFIPLSEWLPVYADHEADYKAKGWWK